MLDAPRTLEEEAELIAAIEADAVMMRVVEPSLSEAAYRDHFAAQVGGLIEVPLFFGRADVVTQEQMVEVEPADRWRVGVLQALGYASQTRRPGWWKAIGTRWPQGQTPRGPLQPTVALFGHLSPVQAVRIYTACRPHGIGVWLLDGARWRRVRSLKAADRQWIPARLSATFPLSDGHAE